MIGLYPLTVNTNDPATTDADGVRITGDSTAHVKGLWTELLPATEFDAYIVEIMVNLSATGGAISALLLDIGYDSAGGTSYTVLIPNLGLGCSASPLDRRRMWIPAYIPAGSTVAARLQGTQTSKTADISIALYGGAPAIDPFPGQGLIQAYGDNEADSNGVEMIEANGDVEGAWAEIVAATTHPHRGIMLLAQNNSASITSAQLHLDVGIGASGSEVPIMENIYMQITGNEAIRPGWPDGVIAHQIPEGSRLSARAQSHNNKTGDQIDVILYGW